MCLCVVVGFMLFGSTKVRTGVVETLTERLCACVYADAESCVVKSSELGGGLWGVGSVFFFAIK